MPKYPNLPYMPLYVIRWQTDPFIQSLSVMEEGVFLRLLMYQWSEGALPEDPILIDALAKARTQEERDGVARVLGMFFKQTKRGLLNCKLEDWRMHHLTEKSGRSKRSKYAASERWRKERERQAQQKMPEHCSSNAQPMPNDAILDTRSYTLLKEETNTLALQGGARLRFDLEALYNAYPRKRGKGKGLERCKREVKSEADYSSLKLAVQNYAASVARTESRYILHFSSFMAQWRDWIDASLAETRSGSDKVATPTEEEIYGIR